MHAGVAIANRIGDDEGDKAVAERIDRGGTHAARSRQAGDDDRVDAAGAEMFGEPGAEKRAGEMLGNDFVPRLRRQFGREIAERVAALETFERRDLAIEDAAFMAVGGIFHAGENDRDACVPSR